LSAAGLLLAGDNDDQAFLSLGARSFVSEFDWRTAESAALQIVSILVDEESFPGPDIGLPRVEEWIFRAARAADLLTLFVPSGSDARDPEWEPVHTLGSLLTSGRPDVGHPVLYLSDQLDGAVRPGEDVPYYRCVQRKGLGRLYILVRRCDDGPFEIIEPGPSQGLLRSVFDT